MNQTPEELAKILMEDDPNPRLIGGLFKDALKQIENVAELEPSAIELLETTFFLGVSALLTVQRSLGSRSMHTSIFVMQKVNQEVEDFFKGKRK